MIIINTEIINDYLAHIKILEEKCNNISKKIEQIYDDKLNGVIEENDYIRYSEKFIKERKQISENIESLKEKIKILSSDENKIVTNQEVKELTNKFLKTEYINKEILFDIVDRIEIDENKKIYIHFNFKQLNAYDERDIENVSA